MRVRACERARVHVYELPHPRHTANRNAPEWASPPSLQAIAMVRTHLRLHRLEQLQQLAEAPHRHHVGVRVVRNPHRPVAVERVGPHHAADVIPARGGEGNGPKMSNRWQHGPGLDINPVRPPFIEPWHGPSKNDTQEMQISTKTANFAKIDNCSPPENSVAFPP